MAENKLQHPVEQIHWQKKQLQKSLKFSIIMHLAIFSSVFVVKIISPSKPIMLNTAVKVDLVGLPDVTKKDLAESTPDPVSQSKEADEDKSLSKALEKMKKFNPKKSTDEMGIKKKEDESRKKSMKNALDRIKSIQDMEESENKQKSNKKQVQAKGNILSQGSSLTGTQGDVFNEYADRMRTRLSNNWDLPVWLSKMKLSAQVVIYLDKMGNVLSAVITKSSNNKQFDEYVMKTIKVSQPFGPPPSEILNAGGVILGFPL